MADHGHDDWSSCLERPVEARRASRIGAQLWVRVGGVDAASRPRVGNLSVTGLYIATEEAVGSPGDLVWLSVSSLDKARSAQTMARVARVVRQDDRHRGAAVVGAGFEFLPLEHPSAEIVDLVRHAAATVLSSVGAVPIERETLVKVSRPTGRAVFGRPRSIRRDGVVIAMPVALAVGEDVRLDVGETGSAKLEIDGKVVSSECGGPLEGDGKHLVTVRFGRDGDAHGSYAERAAAALVETLVAPDRVLAPAPKLQDLSGLLSRTNLSSVLTLVEAVRLDGIVTVANETGAARIYVSGGRIVDAESDHSTLPPKDVIADLLGWADGEFSVVSIPVKREPRLERTTRSLIGDLLRHGDRVA